MAADPAQAPFDVYDRCPKLRNTTVATGDGRLQPSTVLVEGAGIALHLQVPTEVDSDLN